MIRKLTVPLLVAAVAAALIWALVPRPVAVETAVIERQAIEVFLEEEGKSRIRDVFTVSAPIAGRMARLNLHAGDAVVKGETVVASIRPAAPALLDARSRRIAEAAGQAAASAVDLAEAQLAQAEAQLVFLQAEALRAETLLRRESISPRGYEMAELDLHEAEAAVSSARASLQVRERELESARAALMEGEAADGLGTCCTDIRAPASGRVLAVLAESEQVVQPGMPLVEIGDPAEIEIVAELLSRDAVRVQPGAVAEIVDWGGAALPARVLRIDPSASTKVSALGIEEQRVTVVLALDALPEQRAALGHGYRVTVRIAIWHGEDLVGVPLGALFRSGADWAVYVVGDGRATLRRVTLGERNADVAELREGLAEGDRVIVHPNDQVADGVRVTDAAGR